MNALVALGLYEVRIDNEVTFLAQRVVAAEELRRKRSAPLQSGEMVRLHPADARAVEEAVQAMRSRC